MSDTNENELSNEKFNGLTDEECSLVTLFSAPRGRINNEPKLIRVNDEHLDNNIESLIEENSSQLHGEYSFYCVYQKPLGSTERYALIHAFYLESDTLKLEDMDTIILKDGKLMQNKLEEAKLLCDYFYVMPYFDFADKAQGSILLNNRILETNELSDKG